MIRSLRTIEPSIVTRWIFWLVIVIMAVVSLQHVIALVNAVEDGIGARIGLDYRAFVASGDLLRSGNGALLYESDSKEFLALAQVGFVYPPWIALVMVPWSLLPESVGLVLWTALGLVVMVAGLRSCGVDDWRPVAFTLVSFPAVFALGLGQSTFLFVGIVAFSVASMQYTSTTRSGVWLAMAGWKPHLLAGFAFLWVADPKRWWRHVVAGVVATLGLIVVSSVALPGSWGSWISFLIRSVNDLASAVLEASLPGMVSLLIGSLSPIRWVIVGGLAVGLVTAVIAALRKRRASFEAILALVMGAWLLIAPHVVIYDVLILVIPLSMALKTNLRRDAILVGAMLGVGLSLGPKVNQAQLDQWGRAVDLSTVALILAVAMFLFWVWSGDTFFRNASFSDEPGVSARHESLKP